MKDKNKVIEVTMAVLFVIAVIVALIMSWYSMTDLAINMFNVPEVVGYGISAAFDVGGILLALITLSAALRGEGALAAKLGTLAFILTSGYINVMHADMSNYGIVGMVMFGAAPAILFVLFEVYLKHLMKREMKDQGLIPDRMPKVGALAWIRHTSESWNLASKALKARLVKEDKLLDAKLDKYETGNTLVSSALLNNEVEEPVKPKKLPKPKALPELAPAMTLTESEISEPVETFAPVVAQEKFEFGFVAPKASVRSLVFDAYAKDPTADPELVASEISKTLNKTVTKTRVNQYKHDALKQIN